MLHPYTVRPPTFIAASLIFVGTILFCRAHQSPATDIYLDYEILGEDTGAPWIQTIIEGSTHHFPPLQAIAEDAVPDASAASNFHAPFLEYLRKKCPVTIGGTPLEPSIVSFEFTTYEVEDLIPGEIVELPLLLSLIRYDLPTPDIPEEIHARWGAFPQVPPGVTAEQMAAAGHTEYDIMMVSFEDGDGNPDFRDLPKEHPVLIWRPGEISESPLMVEARVNPSVPDLTELQIAALVPPRLLFLPPASIALVPLALLALVRPRRFPWKVRWRTAFALALAAFFLRNTALHTIDLPPGRVADSLPEEQVLPLFTALQRNIYTAFDAPTEDEIYDSLAQSIASGPLLDRVYTEIYQSLLLEEAEGTRATVEDLTTESPPTISTAPDGRSIGIDAHWSVTGIVAHEAHVHRRKNEYKAAYTLAPIEGLWKITGITQNAAERIK